MRTLVLLIAILALVLVDIAPTTTPVHATACTSEVIGGMKGITCGMAVGLLVFGTMAQQYYLAAAGAIAFPTACAMGW